MEIMTTSLSNDVRSTEGLLNIEKNDVTDAHQAAVVQSLSSNKGAITLPPRSSVDALDESEIPSTYVENSTFSSRNGTSDDEGTVDSALLCAMRDQRERVALLRLEQTMLDFMREETTGYIEVGGPSNSVVVSPSGNVGKTQLEQAPGRQTSFQRCCLHRLADRFNIVRETNTGMEGMIRLVKVRDSKIPKRLLIDLDPSEYVSSDENESANGTSSPDGAVRGLANKLADSSFSNRTGKQTQKMKIMKRGSSSFGSSSSLKGTDNQGKGNSSRNRKKHSDKEKAYAEARARIFNESNGSAVDTTTTSDPALDLKPSKVVTPIAATSPIPTPPASKPSSPSPLQQQMESMISSSQQLDDDANRKKGATVSKVTWRNRRQEENDPDFQRISGPLASHYAAVHETYVAPVAPVYGYPQHYFSGSQPYPGQAYASSIASPQAFANTPVLGATPYVTQSPQQSVEAYYAPTAAPYCQGRGGDPGQGGSARSTARGVGRQQANVNSLDEFPSLR